jgi:indole-3-glycerol phosphate synthase
MSDFLGHMASVSHARVGDLRFREPLIALRRRADERAPPPRLERRGRFDLIAEFKRRSPSAGPLGAGDIAARVGDYARGGAAAVSVLTESTQFGGTPIDLEVAAEALAPLKVPVMRKDFIVDPYQVYETRAAGAGGMLLIVRMLSQLQLAELIDCAREAGQFVLLEAFDEEDLARAEPALKHRPPGVGDAPVLIGVNCRDLRTLAVRRERLRELAARLPRHAWRVAESGIDTPAECAEVARAGYELALVGSALMRSPEPVATVAQMLAAGRSA